MFLAKLKRAGSSKSSNPYIIRLSSWSSLGELGLVVAKPMSLGELGLVVAKPIHA